MIAELKDRVKALESSSSVNDDLKSQNQELKRYIYHFQLIAKSSFWTTVGSIIQQLQLSFALGFMSIVKNNLYVNYTYAIRK